MSTTTAATTRASAMTTPDVKAALRSRYAAPEWALMFEVGDGTGLNQRRWADAVAMNLWPSRGLAIHGFEIKVSRGDWLRELKNPAKSGSVQQYCDQWWIVAPAGMIQPSELPPTWGLLEVKAGGQIRQAVDAPKLTPVEAGRPFMAAMLRRASGADEAVVAAMVAAQVSCQRKHDQNQMDSEIERRARQFKDAETNIDKIKADTGVDLRRGWADIEGLSEAIKMVMAAGPVGALREITHIRSMAARIVDRCDGAVANATGAYNDGGAQHG